MLGAILWLLIRYIFSIPGSITQFIVGGNYTCNLHLFVHSLRLGLIGIFIMQSTLNWMRACLIFVGCLLAPLISTYWLIPYNWINFSLGGALAALFFYMVNRFIIERENSFQYWHKFTVKKYTYKHCLKRSNKCEYINRSLYFLEYMLCCWVLAFYSSC